MIVGTTTTGQPTGQPTKFSQIHTSNLSTEELIKSMEELKLQVIELRRTKAQLTTLEQKYDLLKMNVADKTREVNRLEKLVNKLEKDLTLEKPLKEINEILWDNIIQSIKDVWPSIQIMYEHNDLVKLALEEVLKAREELGNMPEEANELIQFLNTQNRHQLEELGIQDRTGTILEIKRVFTKRTLMQNLERRCSDMQEEITTFLKRFDILLNKGLPSPLVSEDKLMDLENYVEKLDKHADNQASTSTSSSTIVFPTGKSLHDRLENLFYLEHEVNHLFQIQPTFFRYT